MSLITLLLSHKFLLMRYRISMLSAGFGSFCAFGSLLFLLAESGEFVKSQQDVLDAKIRIAKRYNVSDEALEAFIGELRDMGFRGLPGRNGTVIEWTITDSLFFVTTLLTTVGYGHYAPRTVAGRMICIFYTAMGIPLTLVLLASYVDFLLKHSDDYKAFLFRNYGRKYRPFFLRLFHVSSLTSLIVLVCFVIPAFVFASLEKGWSPRDGIYFCFISLTTVGLGDMVPGQNPEGLNSDWYKICCSLYLFVGVTLLMFLMAICSDFHRNYKNGYHVLPVTVATEKVPIHPESAHADYGSIGGKTESEQANG